jgi:hypothetical protein
LGAGNPNSKTKQYKTTDAILKIDLNPARSTFGQIVASYEGNVDQYTTALQQLSQSPACAASDNPAVPYPLDDPACGQLDLDFGASANLFRTGNGTKWSAIFRSPASTTSRTPGRWRQFGAHSLARPAPRATLPPQRLMAAPSMASRHLAARRSH